MNKKIDISTVDKHSLIIGARFPFDEEDHIDILFDGVNIATAHFLEEQNILFLEEINLEKHGISRMGIGKIVIDYLGSYFRGFLDSDLIFLLQYNIHNTSIEFYLKLGFKDLETSNELDEDSKRIIYYNIDPWCEDTQILYKFISRD